MPRRLRRGETTSRKRAKHPRARHGGVIVSKHLPDPPLRRLGRARARVATRRRPAGPASRARARTCPHRSRRDDGRVRHLRCDERARDERTKLRRRIPRRATRERHSRAPHRARSCHGNGQSHLAHHPHAVGRRAGPLFTYTGAFYPINRHGTTRHGTTRHGTARRCRHRGHEASRGGSS